MSKAKALTEQLNSVDFTTLLVKATKNNKNYKTPQTFYFTQEETKKSVYVSFLVQKKWVCMQL